MANTVQYCDILMPAATPDEFPWLEKRTACPMTYQGQTYPSAENAFHASRFDKSDMRHKLARMTPESAAYATAMSKDAGPDWNADAIREMYHVMHAKFNTPLMRERLLSTGMRPITMYNMYHDTLWGICMCRRCRGRGENRLGVILEKLRYDLKHLDTISAA